MALSKEESEALKEHYAGKDLYDPSKDPKQETANFQPQPIRGEGCEMCGEDHEEGMCSGGLAMADGGFVPGPDDSSVTGSTDTPKAQTGDDDWQGSAGYAGTMPTTTVTAPAPKAPAALPPPAVSAAPTASSLQPDEYAQLLATLRPTRGQGLAQGAMSGLAGLADAIQSGVARAGPGQFQKNIMESQQNQKRNLIDALREKYDVNFKNRNLDAENLRAKNALAGENQRAALSQAGETARNKTSTDAANARAAAELGLNRSKAEQEENKSTLEQKDKTTSWIGKMLGNADPDPAILARAQGQKAPTAPVPVKTHADYLRLPTGTPYIDSKGNLAIKK